MNTATERFDLHSLFGCAFVLFSMLGFAPTAHADGTAGCKKDSVDPPVDTPTSETDVDATIRMHFSMLNGTDAFQLNSTVVQDSLGHPVKLDDVRFFVSGIHALSDDGTAIGHYEGVYLLVNAAQDSTFDIGAIHASHIHEFHLDLGLDHITNGGDITTAAAPCASPGCHRRLARSPQGRRS